MSNALFDLLEKLDSAKVHYSISRHRPDTVLVSVSVIGQRIEIDVFRDGHMEISRFIGHEDIEGGAELIDSIIALA
ncbi:hypothetical protein GNZ12_20860 [Paraburkholderia sp. 1N]|uniref:Uncharacterized protein n=1 Tax=Paraburkholderia solitsugae TaxID=2675748 RepID=A0ABX2BS23_9BURK|nr:hypothetical protein [Paraburkholderia solitsugae]NPT43712.1 hypothetical protein [Paraburkholderia solitsugae]